jgi:hypothetical protein
MRPRRGDYRMRAMLERAAAFGPWYERSAAGIASLLAGGAALLVGYLAQFGTGAPVPTIGNLSILLPLLGVAGIAAALSIVRREKPVALAVAGLAMGVAAPVVGWVILVAAVAAAALLVLLVIAKFH